MCLLAEITHVFVCLLLLLLRLSLSCQCLLKWHILCLVDFKSVQQLTEVLSPLVE